MPWMLFCFFTLFSALASPVLFAAPTRLPQIVQHRPHMAYLDNGHVKVGIDLNLGGAITYLSPSHSTENMVNLWDFGREIQMAYYAGPVPFYAGDKKPEAHWEHIGWNPIQAGDAFGNPSKVIESKISPTELYTKSVPLHWPLVNEPGECHFEMWIKLEGQAVQVRCRFTNARSDRTFYPARGQEYPAIYTTGQYHRLLSYVGDSPYTGAPLQLIENHRAKSGAWAKFFATERWAALVNDHDFGLGIHNPSQVRFIGGFAGKKREGGSFDNPTGYVAPNPLEIIDWNLVHDYEFELILGKLQEIREHVYQKTYPKTSPRWEFKQSREGWTYVKAQDQGWPIRDGLKVDLSQHNPQLISPVSFWKAEDNATLVIEASASVSSSHARVFWLGLDDDAFHAEKSLAFELPSSPETRTYRIPLSQHPEWQGAIRQLRLDPNLNRHPTPGDWIHVKAVWLE